MINLILFYILAFLLYIKQNFDIDDDKMYECKKLHVFSKIMQVKKYKKKTEPKIQSMLINNYNLEIALLMIPYL